mgnify:CR=1 FL=1
MWIDYAVRQGLVATGAFVRLPLLLNAASHSDASFPQDGDTVISLTTHGTRLKSAAAAIASLLVGNVHLPVHLWLDPVDFHARWPEALRGLADRGLQVHESSGGLGPHTKYYGTFQRYPDRNVITVDDDVLYPRTFAQKLIDDPSDTTITAYRAHRVVLDEEGIAPYRRWKPVKSPGPSVLNFATGVDGVRYPREMVQFVAQRGTEFLDLAPRADDVWLNHCALRAGFPVQLVAERSANFPLVPGSQRVRLSRVNLSGGNDAQIAATYTEEDVAKLRAAE